MANIKPKADANNRAAGDDDPIAISEIRATAPWWPYGIDGTYRLVRQGQLRAIALGRRRYVTVALLRECLSKHTTGASAA